MFEDFCFTDETLVDSEFHLGDADVRINKNYITKFDKFHRPIERVLRSKDIQIIGFNRDTKMTVTIKGNFTISVVEE